MGGLMKTVRIDAPNGAIAVHESAGEGPPVVLIHGNSSSSRVFSRQLDGRLGERFRLIAVDLPGHGESEDAKDPSAYSLPGHARAVRAVVDAFGLHEAWFVGWSLGGHVALEMAPDLPQARGLLIFGAPPLTSGEAISEAFLPNPAMKFIFQESVDSIEASAYRRVLQTRFRRYSAVLPRRCFAYGRAGAKQSRGQRRPRRGPRRGRSGARS
jgi:pimeloyl-ACP methyl ester carboxylesterase